LIWNLDTESDFHLRYASFGPQPVDQLDADGGTILHHVNGAVCYLQLCRSLRELPYLMDYLLFDKFANTRDRLGCNALDKMVRELSRVDATYILALLENDDQFLHYCTPEVWIAINGFRPNTNPETVDDIFVRYDHNFTQSTEEKSEEYDDLNSFVLITKRMLQLVPDHNTRVSLVAASIYGSILIDGLDLEQLDKALTGELGPLAEQAMVSALINKFPISAPELLRHHEKLSDNQNNLLPMSHRLLNLGYFGDTQEEFKQSVANFYTRTSDLVGKVPLKLWAEEKDFFGLTFFDRAEQHLDKDTASWLRCLFEVR